MTKPVKTETFPALSEIPIDERFLRTFKSFEAINEYLRSAPAPETDVEGHNLYAVLALKSAVKALQDGDGGRFYNPEINFLGQDALYFVHKTKPARDKLRYTLDRRELVAIYGIAKDIIMGGQGAV